MEGKGGPWGACRPGKEDDMDRSHTDFALALAAATFLLVSGMLITPPQTFATAVVLLALLLGYGVATRHGHPR
jgi:hypothetical protein